MAHDFKKFPELTDAQMNFYYFQSPHKQITENFRAKVVRIVDGDTVRLKWQKRNFDFPLRFSYIDTRELGEGGEGAKKFLEGLILRDDVEIIINKENRVDKWGRLLGKVVHQGISINDLLVINGMARIWE